MRPTLKRRPGTRVPDRVIAYAEHGDVATLLRTCDRAVNNPKLAAYLLITEHLDDARNELAATKEERMRAVLERQVRILTDSARAAREAAGLP